MAENYFSSVFNEFQIMELKRRRSVNSNKELGN